MMTMIMMHSNKKREFIEIDGEKLKKKTVICAIFFWVDKMLKLHLEQIVQEIGIH